MSCDRGVAGAEVRCVWECRVRRGAAAAPATTLLILPPAHLAPSSSCPCPHRPHLPPWPYPSPSSPHPSSPSHLPPISLPYPSHSPASPSSPPPSSPLPSRRQHAPSSRPLTPHSPDAPRHATHLALPPPPSLSPDSCHAREVGHEQLEGNEQPRAIAGSIQTLSLGTASRPEWPTSRAASSAVHPLLCLSCVSAGGAAGRAAISSSVARHSNHLPG